MQFFADIRKDRKILHKIHRNTKLQDKLRGLQQLANVPELKVINENTTRWNSFLRIIRQFLEVKELLPLVVPGALDIFNWRNFSEIIEGLPSFEESIYLF